MKRLVFILLLFLCTTSAISQQYLRPVGDNAGWNGSYTAIDETSASDSDFIYTIDNPNQGVDIELTNTGITDPVSSSGHIVRWRKALIDGGSVASSAGTGCDLDVEIWQGVPDVGTLIKVIRLDDILDSDTSWTADSYTLSASEADAITDYNDLYIHFHGKGGGGAPSNRRGGGISWLEVQIPEASVPQKRYFLIN